jgi:hypothetical protein
MKNLPVGAELFNADGRTDEETGRHDKASHFSQFYEHVYERECEFEVWIQIPHIKAQGNPLVKAMNFKA